MTATTGEKMKASEAVAKRVIKMAIDGDIQAIRELTNRMDGMPAIKGEVDMNVNVTLDRDLKNK